MPNIASRLTDNNTIMGEDSNFILFEQPDGLSEVSFPTDSIPRSSTTPASIYSTIGTTPRYSEVPSFSCPEPTNPLLTPNSNTSSPPLHQISKLIREYPPPPGSPQSFPSPSDNSKMYHQGWNGTFSMDGQTTQSQTPMPSQVPMPGFLSSSAMPDGRGTPAPPQTYMGGFSVSAPDEPTPSTFPQYYPGVMPTSEHHSFVSSLHPSDLVHSNRNDQFRIPRRGSTQITGNQEPARYMNASTRRNPAQMNLIKDNKGKRQQVTPRSSRQLELSHEHRNCHGEEVQPALVKNCPDEERLLFDLRWKYREAKGADMWDQIQADYQTITNKEPGKEMLQMKFKRARSKYYLWDPKDKHLLVEAFKRIEGERYHRILDCFVELGGSQNMLLSPTDVEVKLVELGLEEDLYMDESQQLAMRRRRKLQKRKRRPRRKRSSKARDHDHAEPSPDDDLMSIASSEADVIIDQVQRARHDDEVERTSASDQPFLKDHNTKGH